MKVALYARISTVNGQQDPEMQLRELRAYCTRRGWEVSSEYVDRISGAKDKRPDASNTQMFIEALIKAGVPKDDPSIVRALKFISRCQNLPDKEKANDQAFTVLGAVAELERSLIVERVKAGLRNARAKGKRLGRPRVSVSAAKIQELRAEGLTLRAIAARCRVSKTTVIRALNS